MEDETIRQKIAEEKEILRNIAMQSEPKNEPQPEADRPKQIPAVIGCISASMIIEYTDHSEHYQCPSRICKSEQQNIDTYYSELHAHKFGWKKTSDIMFCPPDKKYVWVCPSCAKEHEWFR